MKIEKPKTKSATPVTETAPIQEPKMESININEFAEFEEFENTASTRNVEKDPLVCIWRTGMINVNAKALALINGDRFVKLLCNPKTGEMAFKLHKEKAPGLAAIGINAKLGHGLLRAKAFIDHYGLKPGKYTPERKGNMLVMTPVPEPVK